MTIRIASTTDARQMLRIYIPFIRNNAVSFETEVPFVEEFERRINDYMQLYPWIVCEQGNKIIGYAYASQYRDRKAYRWSCECSVYVDEKFRRRGIAEKLYKALFEILKRQGVVNVYAVITHPNPASMRFHEKMGFRKFAIYKNAGYKLGKWHDVHWYCRRIVTAAKNPKETIAFSELDKKRLNAMLAKDFR